MTVTMTTSTEVSNTRTFSNFAIIIIAVLGGLVVSLLCIISAAVAIAKLKGKKTTTTKSSMDVRTMDDGPPNFTMTQNEVYSIGRPEEHFHYTDTNHCNDLNTDHYTDINHCNDLNTDHYIDVNTDHYAEINADHYTDTNTDHYTEINTDHYIDMNTDYRTYHYVAGQTAVNNIEVSGNSLEVCYKV